MDSRREIIEILHYCRFILNGVPGGFFCFDPVVMCQGARDGGIAIGAASSVGSEG